MLEDDREESYSSQWMLLGSVSARYVNNNTTSTVPTYSSITLQYSPTKFSVRYNLQFCALQFTVPNRQITFSYKLHFRTYIFLLHFTK